MWIAHKMGRTTFQDIPWRALSSHSISIWISRSCDDGCIRKGMNPRAKGERGARHTFASSESKAAHDYAGHVALSPVFAYYLRGGLPPESSPRDSRVVQHRSTSKPHRHTLGNNAQVGENTPRLHRTVPAEPLSGRFLTKISEVRELAANSRVWYRGTNLSWADRGRPRVGVIMPH